MRILLAIVLLFLTVFPINGQNTSLKETTVRQKTFNLVWSTINEHFYDPNFGGVDWIKMKEIYQPKAMSAVSDDDFHFVLSQMINELKRSHLAVLSKNQIARNNICREGNIGLKVKIVNGQPVIFRVEVNSSAEKAGLKRGYVIDQIDNEIVSEIFKKAQIIFNQRQISEASRKTSLESSVSRRFCGKPNSTVKIVASDKNDKPQTFQAVREKSVGLTDKLRTIKRDLTYVSEKLENNIGYIAFSSWDFQLQDKFEESIQSLLGTNGLIIDLRGNLGGDIRLCKNLAGYLFTEKVSFGNFKNRFEQNEAIINPKIARYKYEGNGKYTLGPVKHNYKGKIAILVDHRSASTSEVFAAGMQESGRSKVIGERTSGAVLATVVLTLPTGGLFSYPGDEYRTPKGIVLEGRGVEPDISVALTRESLLQGRDLQLETAIMEILGKE